jgi:hypothetical protein
MNDVPQIVFDDLRDKRVRYGRYFNICLAIIVAGFLSMLALSAWKIILLVLAVPTVIAGYSAGVYARNWTKEFLLNAGRFPEDAELGAMISGIGGGLVGTLGLVGVQYALLMIMQHAGAII